MSDVHGDRFSVGRSDACRAGRVRPDGELPRFLAALGPLLQERTVPGHSVAVLAVRYGERVPEPTDLRDHAGVLDQYCVPTRYPNGPPGGFPFMAYTEEQATNAVAAAKRFLLLASKQMSAAG